MSAVAKQLTSSNIPMTQENFIAKLVEIDKSRKNISNLVGFSEIFANQIQTLFRAEGVIKKEINLIPREYKNTMLLNAIEIYVKEHQEIASIHNSTDSTVIRSNASPEKSRFVSNSSSSLSNQLTDVNPNFIVEQAIMKCCENLSFSQANDRKHKFFNSNKKVLVTEVAKQILAIKIPSTQGKLLDSLHNQQSLNNFVQILSENIQPVFRIEGVFKKELNLIPRLYNYNMLRNTMETFISSNSESLRTNDNQESNCVKTDQVSSTYVPLTEQETKIVIAPHYYKPVISKDKIAEKIDKKLRKFSSLCKENNWKFTGNQTIIMNDFNNRIVVLHSNENRTAQEYHDKLTEFKSIIAAAGFFPLQKQKLLEEVSKVEIRLPHHF